MTSRCSRIANAPAATSRSRARVTRETVLRLEGGRGTSILDNQVAPSRLCARRATHVARILALWRGTCQASKLGPQGHRFRVVASHVCHVTPRASPEEPYVTHVRCLTRLAAKTVAPGSASGAMIVAGMAGLFRRTYPGHKYPRSFSQISDRSTSDGPVSTVHTALGACSRSRSRTRTMSIWPRHKPQ